MPLVDNNHCSIHLSVELIVFDMAGTTVRDRGEVSAAFTTALARHGIVMDDDAVRAMRGASKRAAIRQLIRQRLALVDEALDALADELFAAFRTQLMQTYTERGVQAVAGAAEIFAWLRNRQIKVVLNTGFDRAIAEHILRLLAWDAQTVDAVITGDAVGAGRPAPYLIFRAMEATGAHAVRRVVNVGDTVRDLQAGHNAGVGWNVGVLSGAHRRAQMEQEPHTHLLESVAQLRALRADSPGAADPGPEADTAWCVNHATQYACWLCVLGFPTKFSVPTQI